MKIEGAYSIKEYVHIHIDSLEIVIDTTDGYVTSKRHGKQVCLFMEATKEEVLNLVKALVR